MKRNDWRESKQYTCKDCGHKRGIGLMPDCPHPKPPWIKGTFIEETIDDGEYIHDSRVWHKNRKTA